MIPQKDKCFKIHAPLGCFILEKWELVTIPQKIKKLFIWELFSLLSFDFLCKYLVKQFPACCFILKNADASPVEGKTAYKIKNPNQSCFFHIKSGEFLNFPADTQRDF